MLIVLYKIFVPQIRELAVNLIDPVMVIVITIAGIVMMFGAVGMRISNNLGSTVIGAIFRAIGYIVRTIVQVLGWCIRRFFVVIPVVYVESRAIFRNRGVNQALSNLLATVTVILFIVIII